MGDATDFIRFCAPEQTTSTIHPSMCLSTEKNANPSRGDEIENERQESEKPTIQIFTIFIQRDELEGVGLSFQASGDNGLLIKNADMAGLKNGDKVLAINDYSCVGIDHHQAINIMNSLFSPLIEMKICHEISSKEQPNVGQKKREWKFGDKGYANATGFTKCFLKCFTTFCDYLEKKYGDKKQ